MNIKEKRKLAFDTRTMEGLLLAAKLKDARGKASLTQIELAKLTGLTQVYISILESGRVKKLHKTTEGKLKKHLDYV